MAKPTQAAIDHFSNAKIRFRRAEALPNPDAQKREEAMAFDEMLTGLQNMAIGLRATYVLLEEVKDLLQKQRLPR